MYAKAINASFAFLLLGFTSPAFAWLTTSGNGNRSKPVFSAPNSSIHTLVVAGDFSVKLSQGNSNQATITIDENLVPKLTVEEGSGEWRFKLGSWIEPSFKPEIQVTLKDLTTVKVIRTQGVVHLILPEKIGTGELTLHVAGASSVEGSGLLLEKLNIVVSGSSRLLLGGDAANTIVSANGTTMVDLRQLRGRAMNITANGANTIYTGKFEAVKKRLNGSNYVYTAE